MHLTNLAIICLAAVGTTAFRDTSPFFFFSTEPIREYPHHIPSIESASTLAQDVTKSLFECPSDTYIIATQPNVHAEDFATRLSAPHLRRFMNREDDTVKYSYSIQNVLGEFNVDELQTMLEKRCRAGIMSVDASTGSFAIIDDMKPRVIRVEFPELSASTHDRASKLVENDIFLSSIINILPSPRYTVIYTTTPLVVDAKPVSHHVNTFEMEESFQSGFHTDLKRDFSIIQRSDGDNTTLVDGPLFERYQFFTPGLFMGLVVLSILLSILYVGINGVASLQVSYAAFDKDMGPAAQKKQQ